MGGVIGRAIAAVAAIATGSGLLIVLRGLSKAQAAAWAPWHSPLIVVGALLICLGVLGLAWEVVELWRWLRGPGRNSERAATPPPQPSEVLVPIQDSVAVVHRRPPSPTTGAERPPSLVIRGGNEAELRRAEIRGQDRLGNKRVWGVTVLEIENVSPTEAAACRVSIESISPADVFQEVPKAVLWWPEGVAEMDIPGGGRHRAMLLRQAKSTLEISGLTLPAKERSGPLEHENTTDVDIVVAAWPKSREATYASFRVSGFKPSDAALHLDVVPLAPKERRAISRQQGDAEDQEPKDPPAPQRPMRKGIVIAGPGSAKVTRNRVHGMDVGIEDQGGGSEIDENEID